MTSSTRMPRAAATIAQSPRLIEVCSLVGRGRTTVGKVASGPSNREMTNQKSPLRPLPWARPALMSARVPRPTA
jgi:hypothetical protein